MAAQEERARALGLDAEEMAFYDAVAVNFFGLYDEAFLRDLIHDVYSQSKGISRWTGSSRNREDVKATVRAAVRKQLRKRNVRQEDLEPFLGYVLQQARRSMPIGRWGRIGIGMMVSLLCQGPLMARPRTED